MPRLIQETEVILQWTDLEKRVPKTRASTMVRSSGVHLSGIIKPTLQQAGLMDIYDDSDEMPLVVMLGMFFEEGIVTLYPDMIWQPGEVSLDGVVGSPDGITPGPPITQLEEFKLTRKSQRRGQGVAILSEKLWMWQLSGYCHMLGLLQARLHVLWDCGDYKERRWPIYSTYTIGFTEDELKRFWANVVIKNLGLATAEVH